MTPNSQQARFRRSGPERSELQRPTSRWSWRDGALFIAAYGVVLLAVLYARPPSAAHEAPSTAAAAVAAVAPVAGPAGRR